MAMALVGCLVALLVVTGLQVHTQRLLRRAWAREDEWQRLVALQRGTIASYEASVTRLQALVGQLLQQARGGQS